MRVYDSNALFSLFLPVMTIPIRIIITHEIHNQTGPNFKKGEQEAYKIRTFLIIHDVRSLVNTTKNLPSIQ